jgi:UDP-glucose 4-epimerase
MAHAALRFGVEQFLYASSMTVYGPPKRLPVVETDRCVPISYYGISKYAAERFVMATSQRTDVSKPFHATSIRMYNIYGPRQSLTNPYQGVMAILMGNIARNEPITIYGDGNQTRDFLYIDDTVRLWMSCIDNASAYNEVFNGGCDTQISLRTLIKQLIVCFRKDPKTYPVIYKPSRPGEQRYMQADMKKAKDRLGFVPEVDLESGLHKTYLWIMKEQRTKAS